MLQELRKLPLAQCGANMVVGPACEGGHRPIDMHLGMVISGGHLVHQAPLGRQSGMAAYSRLIDKDQLPVLRPAHHQLLQLSYKSRLLLGFGLQVAVAQSTQAESQLMQQLPYSLTAVLDAKAGRDEVADQLGRPHTPVIARLARAAADSVFDRL